MDRSFWLRGGVSVILIGARFTANTLNSIETQRTQSRPDCSMHVLPSSLFPSAPSAVHKLFILPLNTDASATHRYSAPQLQINNAGSTMMFGEERDDASSPQAA
jgi:hypothetical protein